MTLSVGERVRTEREIAALCDWQPDLGVDHFGHHEGRPCPFARVVAYLRGEPDPAELVAEWRVELPITDRKQVISLNDRQGHWAQHAAKVDRIKAMTRNAVMDAEVPELSHVHVELHYRPKVNRVRDADNLVATLKPAIDALHQPDSREPSRWVPIVAGDDARYVSWSRPVFHPATRGAGLALWLILRSQA